MESTTPQTPAVVITPEQLGSQSTPKDAVVVIMSEDACAAAEASRLVPGRSAVFVGGNQTLGEEMASELFAPRS